jgi:hypothetical protein
MGEQRLIWAPYRSSSFTPSIQPVWTARQSGVIKGWKVHP